MAHSSCQLAAPHLSPAQHLRCLGAQLLQQRAAHSTTCSPRTHMLLPCTARVGAASGALPAPLPLHPAPCPPSPRPPPSAPSHPSPLHTHLGALHAGLRLVAQLHRRRAGHDAKADRQAGTGRHSLGATPGYCIRAALTAGLSCHKQVKSPSPYSSAGRATHPGCRSASPNRTCRSVPAKGAMASAYSRSPTLQATHTARRDRKGLGRGGTRRSTWMMYTRAGLDNCIGSRRPEQPYSQHTGVEPHLLGGSS